MKLFTREKHNENINRINHLQRKARTYRIALLDKSRQLIHALDNYYEENNCKIEFYDLYEAMYEHAQDSSHELRFDHDSFIMIHDKEVDEDVLINLSYMSVPPLAIIAIENYDGSLESSLKYAYSDYINSYTSIIRINPCDIYNKEVVSKLMKRLCSLHHDLYGK